MYDSNGNPDCSRPNVPEGRSAPLATASGTANSAGDNIAANIESLGKLVSMLIEKVAVLEEKKNAEGSGGKKE